MIRYNCHSIIHNKSLSEFREWPMENGSYFLIGVAGLNAKTLINSNRWAALRKFENNGENIGNEVEEICRLFTENYQAAQRSRGLKNEIKTAEEIVESIGIFWLNTDGKSFVYKAGKCAFSILKQNGFVIPHQEKDGVNPIELAGNDRLVLDLKKADVVSSLTNFTVLRKPVNDFPNELADFNYPFALAYITTENVEVQTPALELPAAPVDAIPENEKIIEVEVSQEKARPALPEPVILKTDSPQDLQNKSNEPTEKTKLHNPNREKARNPLITGAFIVLIVVGALLISWGNFQGNEVKTYEDQSADSVSMDALPENTSEPGFEETDKPVGNDVSFDSISAKKADDPAVYQNEEELYIFRDADNWLMLADENLRDGKNEQAMVELTRAEKIYDKYISTQPDSVRARIELILNEIRRKKELIEKEDNF